MDQAEGRRRTGILGGTFDPVHNGHLSGATIVLDRLGLDRVLFIPAARPPHKYKGLITPFRQRAAMLELALAADSRFELCAIEENRPGPSYSVDTLRELRRLFPNDDFFFVIGLDAFAEINTWKEWRKLPELAALVVLNRSPAENGSFPALMFRFLPGYKERESGTWTAAAGNDIYFLALEPLAFSSTEIRARAGAGQDLKGLTSDGVADYIRRQGLYE